jgi:H/ACA ribonucleoprotein complex subunit 2
MAATEAGESHKKDKKEKKDKKRKHSEVVADGDEVEVVAERKKKKKDKKQKSTDTGLDAVAVVDKDGDTVLADFDIKDEEDEEKDKKDIIKIENPLAALVPFAHPLCNEKEGKKVLKSVKKGKTSPRIRHENRLTRIRSRQAQAPHSRRQRDR